MLQHKGGWLGLFEMVFNIKKVVNNSCKTFKKNNVCQQKIWSLTKLLVVQQRVSSIPIYDWAIQSWIFLKTSLRDEEFKEFHTAHCRMDNTKSCSISVRSKTKYLEIQDWMKLQNPFFLFPWHTAQISQGLSRLNLPGISLLNFWTFATCRDFAAIIPS